MNSVERPTIVLVLPGFDRQRLSNIRRGWCPLFRREINHLREKGVVRSDASKLTACRKVVGLYKPRRTKSRQKAMSEVPMAEPLLR